MLSRGRVAVALAVIVAATTIAYHAHGPSVPLDLTVYLRGGESVLSGADQVYRTPYGLLPFTYPPFAAVLFSVLTIPSSVAVTLGLTAASYAALYVLVFLSWRQVPRLRRIPAEVPFGVAALIEPVSATIDLGQINLILAAMVLFDLSRSHSKYQGYLLAVAICVKVTPAVFLLTLVLKRDWATLKRVVLACIAFTTLPALFIRHSWANFWFDAIWDSERVGGVAFVGNQSLNGLVWRATSPGGVRWVVILICIAVLASPIFSACRLVFVDALGAIVVVALTGLLLSPISWSHHWVWTVPLIIWLLGLAVPADPVPRRIRIAAGVLAFLWIGCLLSRLLWVAPAGNNVEYASPIFVKMIADAYVLLGVASIAFATWRSASLRRPISGRHEVVPA